MESYWKIVDIYRVIYLVDISIHLKIGLKITGILTNLLEVIVIKINFVLMQLKDIVKTWSEGLINFSGNKISYYY